MSFEAVSIKSGKERLKNVQEKKGERGKKNEKFKIKCV
jgi:hypothetical protein